MKQRVITAIVLLAILAVVVWQINTPVLAIVVAFLAAVASNEIMKCAKVKNKFIVTVGTIFPILVVFLSSQYAMIPWISADKWSSVINFVPKIVYVIALVLVYFLAMLKDYKNTSFEDVTVSFFASVIVPYIFSKFVVLRNICTDEQLGVYFIFYALICALATDSGAQLAGMAFGKHKMSPNISPKKTVEGAVGGLIFSLLLNIVAIILYNKFAATPMNTGLVITLIACCLPTSFLGMMGDLTASVLKRNFGVKDFGKIFPGHGGVMDRFDSSMFTLATTFSIVLVYFYLR